MEINNLNEKEFYEKMEIKRKEHVEVFEKKLISELCNLEKYDPKNIFSENEIRSKYDEKIAPWIQENANEKGMLFCDFNFYFKELSVSGKELEEKWKQIFKEVEFSKLANNIGLIIIPIRDVRVISSVVGINEGISSLARINYASALVMIKSKNE